MIKSIVSSLVAASVLLAPVAAEARGRDGGHRGGRDRGSHIDTGEAIAIGLGALILGAAIGGSREDRGVDSYEERYERPRYRDRDARYRPDRNCYETVVTEYDDWGNRYRRRETRCF